MIGGEPDLKEADRGRRRILKKKKQRDRNRTDERFQLQFFPFKKKRIGRM